MNQNEHLTWQELKDFVNNLPEKELQKVVRWWGDERGGIINYAVLLKKDMVKTEEGWEEKSFVQVDKSNTKKEIAAMENLKKGTQFFTQNNPSPFVGTVQPSISSLWVVYVAEKFMRVDVKICLDHK